MYKQIQPAKKNYFSDKNQFKEGITEEGIK